MSAHGISLEPKTSESVEKNRSPTTRNADTHAVRALFKSKLCA